MSPTRCFAFLFLGLSISTGCGDDTDDGGGGTGGTASNGGGGDTSDGGNGTGGVANGGGGSTSDGGGGGTPCVRELGPADRERVVVIGHPYDDATSPDGSYEALTLSTAGELTEGERFVMGPPADRAIVFTPDGELGFAAQDDGTIGVFSVGADGSVTVIETNLTGDFYADSLAMSPDGAHLWVVDVNFPENGGGIYDLPIGCDGTLGEASLLIETKNASGFLPFDDDEAIVLARAAGDATPVPSHLHRVGYDGSVNASVDLWGNDEAITSWAALTHDHQFVLAGDFSGFSKSPNSVGIARVTATGLEALEPIEILDPYSIATSPYDDAAIVASGFGDAIFVLDYDPSSAAPFILRGELPASPQIPGANVMIDRGALTGLVLITEVRGVYQVDFEPDGEVVDGGVFDLGGGVENNASGIGVQP